MPVSSLAKVQFLDVWRALNGPEPRHGRAPAWWRDSRDLNISIDAERGVFYDHVQNRGGGVLALVEAVLSCDRAAALAWLEGEGFIQPRTVTYEQRCAYARRRANASCAALEIEHWRFAFIVELNTSKLAAVEAADEAALDHAASLCNLLENGSPTDIVREFLREREFAPDVVARLVEMGQQRDSEDRRITAEVVLLLARMAELEAPGNAK